MSGPHQTRDDRVSVRRRPRPSVDTIVSMLALGILLALLLLASDRVRERWWMPLTAAIAAVALELLLERRRATVPGSQAEVPRHRGPGGSFTRSPVAVSIETWSLPKSSASIAECEDAVSLDPARGVVAVSDGASSAYMAREWAGDLTSSYIEELPEHDLHAARSWVRLASARWERRAQVAVAAEGAWLAADMTTRGSYATFLGLRVLDGPNQGTPRWEALAVGDTCLAQLRQHNERWIRTCSFPMDNPGAFNTNPDLVSTDRGSGEEAVPRIRSASGDFADGDVLLLMTDALAQWALTEETSTPASWERLVGCSRDALADLVRSSREAGTMIDDDVTLARVRWR